MSESQTLKVLAYNVQIFPKQIYPVYRLLFDCDGNTKIANRIEKIAENLRSSNADIVMLSEMWDVKSVIQLFRLLKDLYPYSVSSECIASNICFTNDMLIKYPFIDVINANGLMMLSKYPIDKVEFTAFRDKQHAELLVKKGFLISTIIVGRAQVGVIGTHVQAYNYAKTRQSNLRQIMQGIAQYRHENPNNPVIVLGDFNVPYGSNEYTMLQSAMTHEGLFNVQDTAPNGPAMCQLGRDFAHTACYKKSVCDLDYIYTSAGITAHYYTVPDALSPEDLKMSFSSTYRDSAKGANGSTLSDHLPIMAILSIPSDTVHISNDRNIITDAGANIIDAHEFVDRDLTIQNIISFIMILLVAVLSFYYIYSIQIGPVQSYDM